MINYIIFAVLGGLILFLIWILFNMQKRWLAKEEKKDDTSIMLLKDSVEKLNDRMNDLSEKVDEKLNVVTDRVQESNKTISTRLDNSARAFANVTERLAQVHEATSRVFEVGKDISSLQELLRAPKTRGELGELFLGNLLADTLPQEQYQLQYVFKNGEIVDAVIFLRDKKILPIDSKFSLENFQRMMQASDPEEKEKMQKYFLRDVKKRIDEIAKKYILPDEGTLDFAFMYVPAEKVYYEMAVAKEADVMPYAIKKKVIPVSPNTFYVHLWVILLGLKGLQIEKGAKEILIALTRLKNDFGKFSEDFRILGKHISNTNKSYQSSEKRLERFGERLERVEESKPPHPKSLR